MIALLKIEWIKMIRTWMTFVLFIGLPVFFFLLFSGMEFSSNNQEQQSYITSYMLTMTAFSMSSFTETKFSLKKRPTVSLGKVFLAIHLQGPHQVV